MKARITLGIAGALIALTVSFMAFAGTPGAIATQGQPVIAGQNNDETTATRIWNFAVSGHCLAETSDGGLVVCGEENSGFGIASQGDDYGVKGEADEGGTGVFGENNGNTGIGVWGKTGGTGSAVYGQATASGAGVFGDTTNGTGVQARSTNGTALNVLGKAKFSRSGITTIAAGASSKTISLAGLTTASMVLATSQQNSTIFVRSAVPVSGSFTIRLNGVAPTGGLKVAYFVLN
jgi:hypothetical protein